MSISDLMNEQKQIKRALLIELRDENPNENTVLACKHRIRALDATIAFYIKQSMTEGV